MLEDDIKDGLVHVLRVEIPAGVTLRHEDKNTSGIPDISFTWRGYTTWIEVKHDDDGLSGRGVQKITCSRLAKQGRCWYVIYWERKGVKKTIIRKPYSILKGIKELEPGECEVKGFSHDFVVSFVRSAHGDNSFGQERIPRSPRDSEVEGTARE